MLLRFVCSACHTGRSAQLAADSAQAPCSGCGHAHALAAAPPASGRLTRCLLCGGDDLYKRKAFPQQWGVAIVAVGMLLSCYAWYLGRPVWTFGVLFGCALVDLVLYRVMGDCVVCYHCHAEYHGSEEVEGHAPFNLEIHERHRQEAARVAKARAPQAASSSTAGPL